MRKRSRSGRSCRLGAFPLRLPASELQHGERQMSLAFIFPGQGSQAVGMGAELAEAFATARAVFEEVDEALKRNLSKLMREGPEDQLTLTENAQPALMAVSLAVMRAMQVEFGVGIDRAA